MLRFSIALLVAITISETAESADRALVRHSSHRGWHHARVILPAGLPRPHYNFRTTISYGPAPAYRRPHGLPLVYETPEPLYAPLNVVPYWDRLPYACGVYGYC